MVRNIKTKGLDTVMVCKQNGAEKRMLGVASPVQE